MPLPPTPFPLTSVGTEHFRAEGTNRRTAERLLFMPLIPAAGRQKQEGQKFEVILSYMVSLSLAWAIGECVSKTINGVGGQRGMW